ncbi:MAG TPA: DUF1501 domain-containing protein, partial [Urbifossiella sp.]|nr:DUF1501 domain-containing protein [Urbifossiella sp.]
MATHTNCEGTRRREFLSVGSAGLLGLTLPSVLASEAKAKPAGRPAARAKSVILVWLSGGPATIDMWDNKPDAPEGIRGEFRSIPTTAAGMQLAETLPKMAQQANKVSVVRSLYHTIPSHSPATVFMTTGNKPTAALQYPSMGSVASKLLTTEVGVPPYVTFGDMRNGTAGLSGYLGTGYNPFVIEGNGGGGAAAGRPGGAPSFRVRGISLDGTRITLTDLENRDRLLRNLDNGFRSVDRSNELVDGLDTFHQQALDILRSDKTKRAFDLASETAAVRDSYGASPLGQSALAARRLIEAGVRFATVSIGGWDTHSQTFQAHKTRLMPTLDIVLAALIADLDQRG